MILADIHRRQGAQACVAHFDRNGFGYTLDRETGELLVAEKYDPGGQLGDQGRHGQELEDLRSSAGRRASTLLLERRGRQHQGHLPGRSWHQGRAACGFSPLTKLFYVPTNHVCMDYEPFKVAYTAGQPYVGATLSMFPAPGGTHMGNFIAWDAGKGKIVWSNTEQFSVWSGVLTTAGGIACYGTLEGYLKCGRSEGRQGTVQVQDAVRHHRQRLHLRAQGQAVHRRASRASAAGPASVSRLA